MKVVCSDLPAGYSISLLTGAHSELEGSGSHTPHGLHTMPPSLFTVPSTLTYVEVKRDSNEGLYLNMSDPPDPKILH